MMKQNIIQQGAEALIIKQKSNIIKHRISKSYRYPQIDMALRKQRTRKEAKILEKLSNIIPVPALIKSSDKDMTIEMQFLDGNKLSEHLDKLKNNKEICIEIGKNLAKLHNNNIIHGDLTTSNMIYKDKKVFFIDFGLSFESSKIEDKAVDLHLIKEALEAKHFKHSESFFQSILKGYKSSNQFKEVLQRLEQVEKRGRYKQSY